jgi:maltose O-acetyltransferase
MEGVERSMRDRMLAGEPYLFDESLADDTDRCRELLHRINTAAPDQDHERDALLHELLGGLGEGSNIRPPFRCEYGFQIHVGARTFANFGLVWLGGAVAVCPGVTIGRDTVVGAGSVVTRDLPAGVLAVGNPARVVRSIAESAADDSA